MEYGEYIYTNNVEKNSDIYTKHPGFQNNESLDQFYSDKNIKLIVL